MRRLARLALVLFVDGFRAAPGWMTLTTLMLFLGSVAGTCYPLGYRLLVDGALEGRPSDIVWGIGVVAVLMSLGWVLTAIGAVESMALSDRIALYRSAQLIRLISGIPGIEHLERPEYLTEVETLNKNRRQLATAPRLLLSNVSSAARILALLVLLGSVSPWLLLLPLSAAPPLLAGRLARRVVKRAENRMAATTRLATKVFALSTDAAAAGEIRAYGLAGHLATEHRRLHDEVSRGSRREALTVLAIESGGWLVYAAALMGAIAFTVIRSTEGAISLGTVLMTVSLIRRSRAQLASAATSSGALLNALTTADRLFWLQDHATAAQAAAGTAAPPDRLRSGITLRDVHFTYPGTDHVVLDGFNVELPAGSTVALVGENGSGKTTLIKLLLGMYPPSSGELLVDGIPLPTIDPEAWRSRSSAAFQDFMRFHLTAVEAVGVADLPRLDDEPLARAALDRAGAAELIEQLPDGLRTRVGVPHAGGRNLSGGQWQKLALGRAMRRDEPLLIVLDEPTASLDAQAEHALFDRYSQQAARASTGTGAITVLVSHRFSTVRTADVIIYLADGRAAEVGSHAELLAARGKYAELFELQAAGYR